MRAGRDAAQRPRARAGHHVRQIPRFRSLPSDPVRSESLRPRRRAAPRAAAAANCDARRAGGFGLACQRCCCAGESFFRVHYLNRSACTRTEALARRKRAIFSHPHTLGKGGGACTRGCTRMRELGQARRVCVPAHACACVCDRDRE